MPDTKSYEVENMLRSLMRNACPKQFLPPTTYKKAYNSYGSTACIRSEGIISARFK